MRVQAGEARERLRDDDTRRRGELHDGHDAQLDGHDAQLEVESIAHGWGWFRRCERAERCVLLISSGSGQQGKGCFDGSNCEIDSETTALERDTLSATETGFKALLRKASPSMQECQQGPAMPAITNVLGIP